MSTLAIDINDAELVVADETGIVTTQPGYAARVDGTIVTGAKAYAQVRLMPRQTANRYWDELSLEPGSGGIDSVESSAELAFAQLDSLWKTFGGSGDVILVVPGHYDREQLGLLLGLAQECDMPVRAMVNASVAASAHPYPGHQLVYVDAGLHRVSATLLEQGDMEVAAEPEQALNGVGLASLVDLWAKRVAEIFVLQTRFDPFHRAESEQLVYDRLPAWLAALQDEGEASLELPHGDETHRVEVKRDQLLGVAGGFYRALVQLIAQCRIPGRSLVVQLSHRLLHLPGVVSELQRLDDAHVISMPPGAAALGALASAAEIGPPGGQVKLLKRLRWRGEAVELGTPKGQPQQAAPEVLEDARPEPTHLVYRGIAYGVDGSSLFIGREALNGRHTIVLDESQNGVSRSHCEIVRRDGELKLVDLSRFGTFVNEKRVSGEIALHPADIIRIGSPGEELYVIALEDDRGS